MTRLRLADPSAIETRRAEISRIGASVNDPTVFNRAKEACLKKRAFLFVSKDGFVVLQPISGPGVLIWLGHFSGKIDHLAYAYELERFARDINAKRMTFLSNRKGFFKLAPQFGFEPKPARYNGLPITVWTKQL